MTSLSNLIREASNNNSGPQRVTSLELGEGGVWRIVNSCYKRKADRNPIDITEVISEYLPFDESYEKQFSAENIFGMTIHRSSLRSGTIYPAYDGRRLILEVGCESVIYLHIAEHAPTHHRVLIQEAESFFFDISGRLLASEVVRRTRHIETIARYEMYFLMGMLSTISLAMLAAVTGADISVFLIQNKVRIQAYKRLTQGLLTEYRSLHTYAPTLHAKLGEFIAAERKGNWARVGRELPGKVVSDEKAQAQLSGILYGKMVLSSKAFTVWTAVTTVLVQAAVKSSTNSLDAYSAVVDQRYMPLVNDFQALDYNDPAQASRAADKLARLFSEAGVTISTAEALAILREISQNPDRVYQSLVNLQKILEEFRQGVSNA